MTELAADSKKKTKRPPRVKVDANLFKIGDVYYFRKGKTEKRLGVFPDDEKAKKYRDAFNQKRDLLGVQAFGLRAKHAWPDYLEIRRKQRDGEIEGRKRDSPRTFHEIDSVWRVHLRKFFGNRFLADIDDPLWNEYCERAKVNDLTNHRKVLKTFLKWCMKKGYIRALPILDIPAVVRRKRRILTQDQIVALLSKAEGRLLLFVSLYLLMGLRWTEIRLLRWDALNLWKRTLIVHDETTRTRKGRPVKINRFVNRLLARELRSQRTNGLSSPYVFPKRGEPSEPMIDTAMRRPWERLLRRANLTGFTPHDMRATFEYYMNQKSGFTETQMEKMVGASIRMQRDRYLVGTDAEFVAGLEDSVAFDALNEVKNAKLKKSARDDGMGKSRETKK